MNVSGPLLMLFLTAACTVSGEVESRAVWQLGYMIWCVQPGVNPMKYNNSGCYCGLGGKGTPVDEVDQCCKVHDDCYGAHMKNPARSSIFLTPYTLPYRYPCSKDKVTCSASNGECQAALCECDRAAAVCFAQAKHNPEKKDMDQKLCEK
uniref:Phospholipase A2 n=2 Tax=Sparidae TaxID=8169 RepID=A0A7D7KXF3_DIPAN|nr:phospholipase A2 [Diplodus annularis]